jgi:hypothetical protein
MIGKVRLALALLAIVAAVGGPAAAAPDRFSRQHHTIRGTAEVMGKGPCTFEMSWAKLPSAEKTKALQLNATTSCPAGVIYNAYFDLVDEGVRNAMNRHALVVEGDASFSVRFDQPESLHKYVLRLDVSLSEVPFDSYPDSCQNDEYQTPSGSPTGEFHGVCRFEDAFWVKRGNDQLGRVVRLLPI